MINNSGYWSGFFTSSYRLKVIRYNLKTIWNVYIYIVKKYERYGCVIAKNNLLTIKGMPKK